MSKTLTRRGFVAASALCASALFCPVAGCSSSDAADEALDVEGLDELGSVTVVAREEGSGTRSVFSETVGLIETDENGIEVDVTTDNATICDDAAGVIEAVAADAGAIGYASLAAAQEAAGVKTIAVAGVAPSTETVQSGSYALSRDFSIAYAGEATEVEADFLAYILAEGQDIVADGYVPVSKASLFLSDQSEGTILITGSTSVAPLMEELAAAYMQLNANATIEVSATDSSSGLTAAITQNCDWGMASRELEDYEQELLTSVVIAQDAVAVVVEEDNPVDDLSLEQLRRLFSGEATAWSDLT